MSSRYGKCGSSKSLQYVATLLKTKRSLWQRKQEHFNGDIVEQSTQDVALNPSNLFGYSPKGAFKGVQLDYPGACILCRACAHTFRDRLDPEF